jgi:hypothetical protein
VCAVCLCIFANRREEEGDRGAKLTDLLDARAGWRFGEARGEGEAVEGVEDVLITHVCAFPLVSWVLRNIFGTCEERNQGGMEVQDAPSSRL